MGLESLVWLGDECGLGDDMLRLPGHRGRLRGDSATGSGDEQPLDASALVEAELAAFVITGEPEHGARAQCAFDWFLGRNRLDRPLYDFSTGGCSAGPRQGGLDANEGGEAAPPLHPGALAVGSARPPRPPPRPPPAADA